MKLLWVFAALVLLIPGQANAETYSVTEGGDKLTLTMTPCEHPWLKDWKVAKWVYQGKVYDACWKLMGDMVMTIDSAGELGQVPKFVFKKDVAV